MILSEREFEVLCNYIRKECAVEINHDKQYLIESRLSPIIRDYGASSYDDFYRKIQSDHTGQLRNRIVDAITTHETLWFRDASLWRMIEECILPQLAEQLSTGKAQRIKIWSAACSTGQEPYSLAMLIDHQIATGKLRGVRADQFEILGTDISPGSVEVAKNARYNNLEMNRGLTPEYTQKYFRQDAQHHVLNDRIRERVRYRVFNLQDNFLCLGRMDLILCRNVLIYFSEAFKDQLMRRFAMLMNPGAFFLLGSTESGLGHAHTFQMKEHKNAIYYQLKQF